MIDSLDEEIKRYHEAGHGAVALAVGAPLIYVRVRPHSECYTADGWEDQSVANAGASLVPAFSGGAAQYVRWPYSYPDDPRGGVSPGDMRLAERCAARLPGTRNVLFDRAWSEAIRLLNRTDVWNLVEALVAEFREHGEVQGARARELARGFWTPAGATAG
jgi:hypothetical protein